MSEQDQFDEELAALDAFLRAGDASAAVMRLEAFEARLTRYIRGEELVLFPVLERFIAVPFVTTARMRSEHARMQHLLDALREALADHDQQRGLETLCMLRSVVLLHCEKEYRVLAPLLRVTGATSFES
jgi:iron-sulfur cluster repair protein YtfE (RIC family)